MVKTKTSKVNPCGQCHLSTKDGVDCDRCKLWWCLDCLNKSVRGTCTPILYKKLCELGDFPFECEKCCRYLLPVQLVQADIYDEQHLIDKYNVNADAFKYRTDGSHGQPPTTATEPTEETATATATASKLTPSVDEDFQAKLKLMQQGQIQLKEMQNQMQQQMKTQMQMFQEENQKMFQSMFKMQQEEMQRMQEVLAKQDPQEAPTATTEMQVLAHTIATAISTATGTVTEDAARSRRQPSHLPRTPLPTFSGDVLQWEGFWESFNLNVHSNRDIDHRFKMDALRNLLNGAAYDKIAGLGITGEAYPEAIRVLESNYGNKQAQLEAARAAVSSIPAVKGDYGNLEKATDDFRTATSKLARMGVGNSALNEHANLFFCKLPMKLQLWIKEKRMDQGKWEQPLELPELLQLLQRAKLLHVKESQTNVKRGKEGEPNSVTETELPTPTANFLNAAGNQTGGYSQSRRHGGKENPQRRQQDQQRQPQQRQPDHQDRPGQSCVFCAWNRRNDRHRSEDCRSVGDISARWNLVRQAGLCFKCFKKGHSSSNCSTQGNCGSCKGSHHIALCSRRRGQGSQMMLGGGEVQAGHGRSCGAKNPFTGNKCDYKGPMGHGAGSVNGHDAGYNCNSLPGLPHRKVNSHWDEGTGESIKSTSPTTGTGTTATTAPTEETGTDEVALTTAVKADEFQKAGVVMTMFPAELKNTKTGTTAPTGVFVDQGATYSTMSKQLAKKLNLPVLRKTVLVISRYNSGKKEHLDADVVKVTITTDVGEMEEVVAYAIETLAPPIQSQSLKLSAESMKKLKETSRILNLPPKQCRDFHVGLILGNDYWHDLMMGPSVKITRLESSLFLYNTCLGGIIGGCIKGDRSDHGGTTLLSISTEVREERELELSKFWDLDVLGIAETKETTLLPESAILKDFKSTVYKEDDRYYVRLPFKTEAPELSTNYKQAEARLEQQTKTTTAEMREAYYNVFKDYEKQGMIEKVTWKGSSGKICHYLSHFMVLSSSKTTPIRPVFDASAKGKRGVCLNDCLYTGGSFLEELTGILMRMRLHKYAMQGDLAKAFLQVGLHESDRDACRLLLPKDPAKPSIQDNVQVYRFTRNFMGTNCGPFLLGATINYHLDKEKKNLDNNGDDGNGCISDNLINELKGNIYADNLHMGFETTEEGQQYYEGSKLLMRRASMPLREFATNNRTLMTAMATDDKVTETKCKMLGLEWDLQSDQLQLKELRQPSPGDNLTKRKIFSINNSLFDPLGFYTPVSIRGKLFIQELYNNGSGNACNKDWDCNIPENLVERWKKIEQDFRRAHQLKIPRQVLLCYGQPVTLVAFCDASPQAYCTCIYIHQDYGGQVSSRLVFSKARVAPREETKKPKPSLPRLELIAILIGCRALKFVSSQLRIQVSKKILFSDSMIALSWVRSKKTLRPYEERRVQEIRDAGVDSFCYINTSNNIADAGTRGYSCDELLASSFLTGPSWLLQPTLSWPSWQEPEPVTKEVEAAVSPPKKTMVAAVAAATTDTDHSSTTGPLGMDVSHYSSADKMLRVLAYALRFIKGLRKQGRPGTSKIVASEMEEAELLVVRYLQGHAFESEIGCLISGKRNQLCTQLDLQLGVDGILRVGGRMANARISESAKHPMLLPRPHEFTRLQIWRAHEDCFHFGEKTTLAWLRSKYWVPQGLSIVKKTIKSCLICRRSEGGPYRPPNMGQLPAERLSRGPAYYSVGLDYLGPLLIKNPRDRGGEPQKRWIALFTDPVIRCIHLEIIPDCSAESCLRAFERFTGRRGVPAGVVMSDNATQFGKVAKTLEAIWDKKVADELHDKLTVFFARHRIHWRTIPARAAFVGGYWERLVGLVKRAIKKTLWRASVTDDELHTLVVKIEGVLNCRPLTSPSTNVNDGAPLTPASFLSPGTQLGGLPFADDDRKDPDFLPASEKDVLREWKRLESKVNQCWSIFQKSYLQELRETHVREFKKRKKGCDWVPNVGDTTLVMDATPRATWKLARVERLLPGPDGAVRFVEICLPTGQTTTRSVQHLCPLETVQGGFEREPAELAGDEEVEHGDGEREREKVPAERDAVQPTARALRAHQRDLRRV